MARARLPPEQRPKTRVDRQRPADVGRETQQTRYRLRRTRRCNRITVGTLPSLLERKKQIADARIIAAGMNLVLARRHTSSTLEPPGSERILGAAPRRFCIVLTALECCIRCRDRGLESIATTVIPFEFYRFSASIPRRTPARSRRPARAGLTGRPSGLDVLDRNIPGADDREANRIWSSPCPTNKFAKL